MNTFDKVKEEAKKFVKENKVFFDRFSKEKQCHKPKNSSFYRRKRFRTKRSSCSYCGNAPINHTLSFLESLIFVTLDNHTVNFIKYIPRFIKSFVDFIPGFLFETLALFKLVKFSSDIEKAYTFRSRIIWEEAQRRGIKMKQVMFLGKPLDFYQTNLRGKNIYFESIPITPEHSDMSKNWDDKVVLKKEFSKGKMFDVKNRLLFLFVIGIFVLIFMGGSVEDKRM